LIEGLKDDLIIMMMEHYNILPSFNPSIKIQNPAIKKTTHQSTFQLNQLLNLSTHIRKSTKQNSVQILLATSLLIIIFISALSAKIYSPTLLKQVLNISQNEFAKPLKLSLCKNLTITPKSH
jgi:hypothetical protein